MKIDSVERVVRWAGLAGLVVYMVAVYVGVLRGARRAKSSSSGTTSPLAGGLIASYTPSSVVVLWLLYKIWRPLPLRLTTPARVAALILGCVLYFPGLALMLWGRIALGEMYNVSTALGARLYAGHRLVTTGPFALVRHPIYLGAQLGEAGALLLFRTWATLPLFLFGPMLALRARQEERALAAEFGAVWEEYVQRVPAGILGLTCC